MEARGRIVPTETGSRVHVVLGPSARTNFGLAAPIAFVVLWTALAAVAGTTDSRPTALIFGACFLMLLLASAGIVNWVGRNDDTYLEAVLRSALATTVA